MATRNDVDIDFNPSPRVVTVGAPSTELIAQDVVDTLRVQEESWRGLSETKLIDAAGKENLGGGVQVGITTTLQNTQIAFEGRTAAAQTGTVTTASSPPVVGLIDLYDTSATFESNNVARGSLVINFTDQSIAEVFSVESETHLKTRTLVNGIDNSFDLNDDYQVFNIVQCDVLGGNVVAVDDNDTTISPVLPTPFTQIVRTSSSSATIQNQKQLEASTFNQNLGVVVAPTDPNASANIKNPTGTREQPAISMAVGRAVAEERNFKRFFIAEDVNVTSGDFSQGYTFIGDNSTNVLLNSDGTADFSNAYFENIQVTGYLNLGCTIRESVIVAITNVTGFIFQTFINNSIAVGAGTLTMMYGKGGTLASPVVVDMSNNASVLVCQDFNGVIKLTNLDNAAQSAEIHMAAGHVIIDSSCTQDDAIILRGSADITNNTTAAIDASGLVDPATLRLVEFNNVISVDETNGEAGTSDEHGTPTLPVNNLADAITLNNRYGFGKLKVSGALTVTQDLDNITIEATDTFVGKEAESNEEFNINGHTLTRVILRNLTVTGDMTGSSDVEFDRCFMYDITGASGETTGCRYTGTIIIEDGAYFSGVGTVVEGEEGCTIDFNNNPSSVFSHDVQSGYLFFINMVGGSGSPVGSPAPGSPSGSPVPSIGSWVDLNLRGGEIEFDDTVANGGGGTVTGGYFYAEGYGYLYNGSGSPVITPIEDLGIEISANHLISNEATTDHVWARDVTASAPPPTSSARHLVEGGMQNGAVWLDGVDGSDTQEGTVSLPLLTFTQARLVLIDYQMKRLRVVAMVDTTLAVSLDNYEIIADNNVGDAILDINNQSVANTYFEGLGLTGNILVGSPLPQGISCANAKLYSPMTGLLGTFKNCGFVSQPSSPIESFQLRTGQTSFIDCYVHSVEAGNPIPPQFDVSGTNVDVVFRRWSGSLEILGLNDSDSRIEIEATSGTVTIDATCTAGIIVVRGDCELVNNATGSPAVTVIDERTTYLAARDAGYQGGMAWVNNETGDDSNDGIATSPVKTLEQGKTIAQSKNLRRLRIVDSISETLVSSYEDFEIIGDDSASKFLVLNGQNLNNTSLIHVAVTGDIGGYGSPFTPSVVNIDNALLYGPINKLGGVIRNSSFLAFPGTGSPASGSPAPANFAFQFAGGITTTVMNCTTANVEQGNFGIPVMRVNEILSDVCFRNWTGPMHVDGLSSNFSDIEIDCTAGEITILNTCVLGTIRVRGSCTLIDNSGPNCTVINETTSAMVWRELAGSGLPGSYGEIVEDIIKYHKNRTLIDENNFTLTVFDDGSPETVLRVFDLKDENGVASITSIFERIPQ